MDEEYIRLFNLFKNDMYRLAFSYTKNYSDSDDIVQSVFIKLYKNFNKFDDDTSIKKWLTKVTINECKTLFLSAWKKKVFPMTDNEENITTYKKQSTSYIDSLFQLPKKYRIVLFLFYYEDYKIKEISEILNLNESTVKTRLSRARSLLKEVLKGGMENE